MAIYNIKGKALVVIDLQQGVNDPEHPLFQIETLIERVNQRIALYRKERQPILFIQHNEKQELVKDSKAWQLFPDLDARETDFYVDKTHANSFYQTSLQQTLEKIKCTQFEICGAQTEFCIDTTIRMAHGLGYECFMQRGMSTTADNDLLYAEEIIRHHEDIWNKRFLQFIE